jgi:RNA polymerase sigma-70 factor, ECF subfamily
MPSCVDQEIENSNISEEDTVRRAQEGDAAAFEQLYRRYSKRVYSLCLRIIRNDGEAEELTQEAFLLLFRKIHTFRGDAKFSTWLHRLSFNVALMRLRKKRHAGVSLEVTLEPGEDDSRPAKEFGGPDLRLSGIIDQMNLNRAIAQLPHGYKEKFILHDVEGYEHHEIAGILGCSVGNSKSQLFKARLRLRRILREALRSKARELSRSSRIGTTRSLGAISHSGAPTR